MSDRIAVTSYVGVKLPGTQTFVRAPHKSLAFEDEETKTDKVSIVVDNYDLSAFDGDLWLHGNEIEFSFGYPGNMSPMRQAVIVAWKGWHPLTIEADAKSELLNRIMRTDRLWENVKRSDVVRQILAEYGFTGESLHIEDTKAIVPSITQAGVTDLQLIRRFAASEGFEFYFDWDGVHFHARRLGQKPSRVFTYFVDTGRCEIADIQIDENKRLRKAGKVTTEARDPITGEVREIRTDNASTANESTKLGDGTGTYGTEVTEAVNAQSGETVIVEKPPDASALGANLAQDVVAGSAETPELAARAAAGAYRKSQLKGVTLSFSVPLDPQLFAKTVCELRAVGVRMGGNWYIKSAKHDTDAGKTSIKIAREGSGAANAAKKNDEKGETTADGERVIEGPGGVKWVMREFINDVSGEKELRYVEIPAGAP